MSQFLPQWPGAHTELEDFSFGTIATQCTTDTSGVTYTFRLTHMQRKERFNTTRVEPGYYLHIRLQGHAFTTIGDALQELPRGLCSLFYLPTCELLSEVNTGIGSSLMINISAVIEQYAADPHIAQLLTRSKANPNELLWLFDTTADCWLNAAINLLLNAGKDSRNSLDMNSCWISCSVCI